MKSISSRYLKKTRYFNSQLQRKNRRRNRRGTGRNNTLTRFPGCCILHLPRKLPLRTTERMTARKRILTNAMMESSNCRYARRELRVGVTERQTGGELVPEQPVRTDGRHWRKRCVSPCGIDPSRTGRLTGVTRALSELMKSANQSGTADTEKLSSSL